MQHTLHLHWYPYHQQPRPDSTALRVGCGKPNLRQQGDGRARPLPHVRRQGGQPTIIVNDGLGGDTKIPKQHIETMLSFHEAGVAEEIV